MRGWLQYLRKNDSVKHRFFFASSATSIENVLKFANTGVDVFVFCGLRRELVIKYFKLKNAPVPVVVCSYSSKLMSGDLSLFRNAGVVMLDSPEIGRHVGRVFCSHGLVHFGFVAMNFCRECISSRERCDALRAEAMADNPLGEKTFDEIFYGVCSSNEDSWDSDVEQLEKWVRDLPKPCGVLANGDRSALQVIDACHSLGIDIPGQIELISINNSHGLCEDSEPTISSIQPDYGEFARHSIEMAVRLAGNGSLCDSEKRVVVSANVLHERGSSLVGCSHGNVIARAKEYIRKNACSGISVMDVAKYLGLSRRTLELWFKASMGTSVMSLIRKVRMENMCLLLKTTNLTISDIIIRSGFNLTANAGVIFKRAYGLSMRQYRSQCGGPA